MATTKKSTTAARKSTPAGRKTRSATRPASRGDGAAAGSAEPETVVSAPVPMQEQATEVDAADVAPDASGEPEPFRRPDLIQAVAARCAVKRSEAKDVLELVLEELGKALDAGDELVLQPLGKISVKKRRATGGGEMLTLKLKRSATAQQAEAGTPDETPLADPAADS